MSLVQASEDYERVKTTLLTNILGHNTYMHIDYLLLHIHIDVMYTNTRMSTYTKQMNSLHKSIRISKI